MCISFHSRLARAQRLRRLLLSAPQSVLATLAFPMGPAVLHDATIMEDVRQCLLRLIEKNATLALKSTGERAMRLPQAARQQPSLPVRARVTAQIETPLAAAGVALGRRRRASARTD